MGNQRIIKALAISGAILLLVVFISVSYAKQNDSDETKALEESYKEALRASSSTWLNYKDTCYVYLYQGGGKPNSALATFDIDDTLIKPVSNKKLPKNATDWEYLSDLTKVRVEQETRDDRARFLMFSNQAGVSLGKVTLEEIQKRVELVAEGLGVPCTAFISTRKDEFRKPGTGMFDLFKQSFNGAVAIDYEHSFFCGDALGYPAFSDSDLKFAQANGLPFISPEDFLSNKEPKMVKSN